MEKGESLMIPYWRTWYVQTAHRARLEGVPVSRDYGYVVRVRPAPAPGEYGKRPGCESLEAWCKTKGIADYQVQNYERYLALGYFECPCGSGVQARGCCGIPPKPPNPCPMCEEARTLDPCETCGHSEAYADKKYAEATP